MTATGVDLYWEVSAEIGGLVTTRYSTSFRLATRLLATPQRSAIYAIYGYVRVADELVDSFPPEHAPKMLAEFRIDTKRALERGLSANPIIQAMADAVGRYDVDFQLIWAFLDSMAMDTNQQTYNTADYRTYIYGSAEVVGLMCLAVFCRQGAGDDVGALKKGAQTFGAALQKVNFLRDIASDVGEHGRQYFPDVDASRLRDSDKRAIEREVRADFAAAVPAINALPLRPRLAVAVAYRIYLALLMQLEGSSARQVMHGRIRVGNFKKFLLAAQTLAAQGLLRRPLRLP